ncbi:2OG-Fe(II) oxygenase family protein [Ferrimonas pelagia]|uniref:2OG-Fe(II) oxygenase family protein n=1 Tax=Ferrimonas pelagia TaxID=1177826 RepID=A0ABP9EEK9_9GAMM
MAFQVVDYRATDAAEQFAQSLCRTGVSVLTHHPIPADLVLAIHQSWSRFFRGGEKGRYRFNGRGQDGYFPARCSNVDSPASRAGLKEYFHFYPWGQCPPELRTELSHYFAQAGQLAAELVEWLQHWSPARRIQSLSEPLPQMIHASDKSLLRVQYWSSGHEDGILDVASTVAEANINLLTLLPTTQARGVQIQDQQGQWLDVPSQGDPLIVYAGEMLQELSGGELRVPVHRVLAASAGTGDSEPIALPFMLQPRPEVRLSDRYTAESYLNERRLQLGQL